MSFNEMQLYLTIIVQLKWSLLMTIFNGTVCKRRISRYLYAVFFACFELVGWIFKGMGVAREQGENKLHLRIIF